jgi:UDP-glucose 4-epimerase
MSSAKPAVVVTGISGNLGRTLAKQLHKQERIIGIDRRPFPGKPKDMEIHELDLRKKKTEDIFRRGNIKSVIHMGIMHDPRMSEEEHHSFNVVGTTRILEYCARYGVKKVVVLSSANVYGPSPDNSNFLTEDAPLMAASRFSGVRDLIEVDMLAHGFFWKNPDIQTVILRPVHIVGPTVRNAPSNYLRLEHPITALGFDPMVQLIHEEDVGRALALALQPGVRGLARDLQHEASGALARHDVFTPGTRRLQDPDAVGAVRLGADDLARGRRQALLVGVEHDADVRLRPGPRPRLLVRPQRIQQRGQPALHVVHARAPRAALIVDAKRALLGRARREYRVVVAHEEEALGPGAGLVADQVIAEAVVDDTAHTEAEALEPLDQDGAHAVDVQHVVGAAVVVHQAGEKLDLLVAPAVEAVQEVAHRRMIT